MVLSVKDKVCGDMDKGYVVLFAQVCNLNNCLVIYSKCQVFFLLRFIDGCVCGGIDDAVGLGGLDALCYALSAAEVYFWVVAGGEDDVSGASALQLPSKLAV
jgi:hypothetical protein